MADAAEPAGDERVPADTPAGRAIAHVDAKPEIVGPRALEIVGRGRPRAIEDDVNLRQVLEAAPYRQRRPVLLAERVDGNAGAVAASRELQDVDRDRAVARAVVERFELRGRDVAADEILERILREVQRLRIEPVVADRDELTTRLR